VTSKPQSRVQRAEILVQLFDRRVAAFELRGRALESDLHPSELRSVSSAVAARRLEFAGGRLCARAALTELGAPERPLLVGPGREPLWPDALVGSISHTAGYCGAVAASTWDYRAIGIDVEVRGELTGALEDQVCTPAEIRWLDSQPTERRTELATIIFSAKEAFYKCQFCVTASWLDFHDVTIEVCPGEFAVSPSGRNSALLSLRTPLSGRYHLGAEHVFTGIGIAGTDGDSSEPGGAPTA